MYPQWARWMVAGPPPHRPAVLRAMLHLTVTPGGTVLSFMRTGGRGHSRGQDGSGLDGLLPGAYNPGAETQVMTFSMHREGAG